MHTLPPITLYIHIPWCVKKCPYCDFNSHEQKTSLPEEDYINRLISDFDAHRSELHHRPINAVFIGGGTPSLFKPQSLNRLLRHIRNTHPCSQSIEITMEANPGTVEYYDFAELRATGINRLSLGIQSFNADMLKSLGRIHSPDEALLAINKAKHSGFDNINLDLMFGLPHQTQQQALDDLHLAIAQKPQHISWYQLTIEPYTAFYYKKPPLPNQDHIWEMQQEGVKTLHNNAYPGYEISAYSQSRVCQHNLNYWLFGDYLGLGAGAHSKLTCPKTGTITRTWRHKHPKTYLSNDHFIAGKRILRPDELPLEYLMNRLRLNQALSQSDYVHATGCSWTALQSKIAANDTHDWINMDEKQLNLINPAYLDEILGWFLPNDT